jgi:hypothetical protein
MPMGDGGGGNRGYNLNCLPLPERPGPTAKMPRFYDPYLAHVMPQSLGQHAHKYAP